MYSCRLRVGVRGGRRNVRVRGAALIEVDRRRALVSAAGLVVGGMTTARLLPEEMLLRDRRLARSKVAIISADMYSEALVDSLTRALSIFRLNLRHKSVLLKPNCVEYRSEER